MKKIDKKKVKALAISFGLLWGLCLFFTTLAAHHMDYGAEFLASVMSIYPGYDISVKGSFLGFIYGFIDGLLIIYIIAYVYDFILSKVK